MEKITFDLGAAYKDAGQESIGSKRDLNLSFRKIKNGWIKRISWSEKTKDDCWDWKEEEEFVEKPDIDI